LGERLRLTPEAGSRLSHIRAAAPAVPGVGDVDYAFTGVTGSARLALVWPDKGILFTGWSQGFRAPNLQETTALGDTGNFFEVPNGSLGPERSDELEVGGRVQLGPVWMGASAFYARVHDVIARREATFEGETTVNGAPVRQRYNADRASYLGAEAELQVQPLPWLGLRANLTWIEGDVESDGETEPARRVPPLHGLAALRFSQTNPRAFAEVRIEAAADQDRLNSGDLTDLRICGSSQFPGVLLSELGRPCGGTPGWVTLGLRGGVTVSEHLSVTLDVDNLFDERYRHHGSGIDEPGYNAALTAEVGW
jgi:outer membrane receptor protein involved in Fe transport